MQVLMVTPVPDSLMDSMSFQNYPPNTLSYIASPLFSISSSTPVAGTVSITATLMKHAGVHHQVISAHDP
jgi:hypothetical protein